MPCVLRDKHRLSLEMLQFPIQSIPFVNAKESYKPAASPGLSFLLLLTDSDSDLLPDLWQDTATPSYDNWHPHNFVAAPSQLQLQQHLYPLTTFGGSPDAFLRFSPPAPRSNLVWNSTPNYVTSQLSVPLWLNSFGSELTEENLQKYDVSPLCNSRLDSTAKTSVVSEHSEDMFEFEPQHYHPLHPHHHHQSKSHLPPITSKQHKQQHVNTQLYKTELCALFVKLGVCPYGNKCQFAHGENELKDIARPPKWRSKPCANWTKFGSCRYGNRCCFQHND